MTPEEIQWEGFRDSWRFLSTVVRASAEAHGFHTADREDGTLIALIHSELSECLEAVRHDNPASTKILGFSNMEEELADVVIRVADYAQSRGLNLAGAIEAKHKHNLTRNFCHGGKKF